MQVTGIVLMVIGGVLLLPLMPWCYLFVSKRRKHAAYMTSSNDFEPRLPPRPSYDRSQPPQHVLMQQVAVALNALKRSRTTPTS
jgi:hypothetical protein